jgi:hypothetical protein
LNSPLIFQKWKTTGEWFEIIELRQEGCHAFGTDAGLWGPGLKLDCNR